MCGRFVDQIGITWDNSPGAKSATVGANPTFNASPGQLYKIGIRYDRLAGGVLFLQQPYARWGFIRHDEPLNARPWANARDDKIKYGRYWTEAFAERRCIVHTEGWYEWQKLDSKGKPEKQPWFICRKDRAGFWFAGIWSEMHFPEPRPFPPLEGTFSSFKCFATITTKPSKDVAHIHDRMPVVLSTEQTHKWLDPKTPREELLAMLQPLPEGTLEYWRVSKRVNSPKNNDPKCMEPLDPPT